MKKKIINYVCLSILIAVLIAIFIIFNIVNLSISIVLTSISIGLLGVTIPYFINMTRDLFFDYGWHVEVNQLIKNRSIRETEEFRISYAYLFRIEIGGKFLLINDTRKISTYKPMGGTYLLDDCEKQFLIRECMSREDDIYTNLTFSDYRMIVPAKFLGKFYKRFDKKHANSLNEVKKGIICRLEEIGLCLTEEMLELKKDNRDIVIKFPKYFKYYEMVLSDIYVVNFNDEIKNKILDICNNGEGKTILATYQEIIRRGCNPENGVMNSSIADHCYKILPNLPKRNSHIEY